jgi:hypothetical protein
MRNLLEVDPNYTIKQEVLVRTTEELVDGKVAAQA